MWQAFDGGSTRGGRGSEEGRIVVDDEYEGSARITLEEGCRAAPLAITCGLYGWLVHTRFFSDEGEAQRAFADMKGALVELIRLATVGDGDNEAEVVRRTSEAVRQFVERYP